MCVVQYALERNFAPNLFSLYSAGPGAIFQIDANFGFAAALLVRAPCIFPGGAYSSLANGFLLVLLLAERFDPSPRRRVHD